MPPPNPPPPEARRAPAGRPAAGLVSAEPGIGARAQGEASGRRGWPGRPRWCSASRWPRGPPQMGAAPWTPLLPRGRSASALTRLAPCAAAASPGPRSSCVRPPRPARGSPQSAGGSRGRKVARGRAGGRRRGRGARACGSPSVGQAARGAQLVPPGPEETETRARARRARRARRAPPPPPPPPSPPWSSRRGNAAGNPRASKW